MQYMVTYKIIFLHPVDTYYFFASFRLTAGASSWAVAVFSSAAIVTFPLVSPAQTSVHINRTIFLKLKNKLIYYMSRILKPFAPAMCLGIPFELLISYNFNG